MFFFLPYILERQEWQHTGEDEQHKPVHQENGPENRDVEDLEPAAHEGDGDGASGRVPELELGETSDEGPELLVLLGRESANSSILHIVVERIVRGVKLGLEEGEEEVEEIDSESIRNCFT